MVAPFSDISAAFSAPQRPSILNLVFRRTSQWVSLASALTVIFPSKPPDQLLTTSIPVSTGPDEGSGGRSAGAPSVATDRARRRSAGSKAPAILVRAVKP